MIIMEKNIRETLKNRLARVSEYDVRCVLCGDFIPAGEEHVRFSDGESGCDLHIGCLDGLPYCLKMMTEDMDSMIAVARSSRVAQILKEQEDAQNIREYAGEEAEAVSGVISSIVESSMNQS